MAEVTQLTLAVDSRQVRTATSDLDKFGKAGKTAERDIASAAKTISDFGNVIKGAFAGQIVGQIIRTADAYQSLNARLRLATSGATEFGRAQQEIFRISQLTRSGLQETSGLYESLARSTQTLGVSQDELLRVTETINKAFAVSGTSAADAQGAIVQLGQAFASGALRGDELNSILERAPALARGIASGLGVSVGQLRQLGAEGQLTSEKIFRALQKSGADFDNAFKQIPNTVEGSLQQVSNSISRLIGQLNQATGATGALASALSGLSRGIDNIGDLAFGDQIARARAELDLLQQRRETFSFLPNVALGPLDRQIAAAEIRLRNLQQSAQQTASDIARENRSLLGRFGNGQPAAAGPAAPNLGTVAGITQQINELRKLRDASEIGSASFNKYTAEIRKYEQQLAALNGRSGGGVRAIRDVTSEADRYIESLKQQLQTTENLSVEETLLRDIQSGRLGNVTAKQQLELQNLASQIDAARIRIQQEQDLTREIERQAQAEQQAAKAAQDRLQAFIDATPTGQLRIQNEELDFLKEALDQNKISLEQYAEIVRTRFVEGSSAIKEQKSLVDELGLTFTSAFEDAITSGKGFSGILKGIEQDLIRIATRKLVTEPLGNLFSSFFGSGGAGGSFLSDIGGGIQNFVSGFGGGTAASIFGRAIGGPVSAGGLYRVNERGPELLTAGGNQYLMMGNQGGRVDPNVPAANSQNININVQVPQGATRETGLQFGRVIAQQLNIANARNG